MTTIFDVVFQSKNLQLMLMVTNYIGPDGNFLCIPIKKFHDDIKMHISAMGFFAKHQLQFEGKGIVIADDTIMEIQEYILKNEKLFKDKIKNYNEIMSETDEGNYTC